MIHIFYTAIPTPGRGSATAHTLAAYAYAELTGQKPPQICKYPNGKPYFAEGPWQLSISHTADTALCALSDSPVGLDAERPRPVPEKLMVKCLAPAELAVCQAAADPQAVFLRFWTLKEAYAKYDGCGIIGYPNGWRFTLEGETARLEGQGLWFRTLQVEQMTISVCCVREQPIRLHLIQKMNDDQRG